jgi:hypothetical protein
VSSAAVGSATEAALVNRIIEAVNRINTKTGDLQNQINSKLGFLPDGMQDKVISGWNAFCDAIKGFWDFWNEVATHMGSPSKLTQTADLWSDQIAGPVSGQVQYADAGLLEVDTNWDGTAAEAYRQTLPLQKTALQFVKTNLVDGIGSALSEVSRGIVTFWSCLLGAMVAFIAGLASAFIAGATIFGLPAAPILATAAAVVAVAAVIGGGMVLKSACSSAATTLRQKLDENTGYPGGHWPPAAKA